MKLQNQSCTNERASLVLLQDVGSGADSLPELLAERGYSCASVTTIEEVLARVADGAADLLIITCAENPWRDLAQIRAGAAIYLPAGQFPLAAVENTFFA